MKFTIVTPSYNQGRYIERTIKSVLSQKGVELEYIVMDNCSSDATKSILEHYQALQDDRLTITIRPDQGQFDAINQGWMNSTGEILAWLNSDDVYCAGALASVAQFFNAHPDVMAVYGEAIYISADDRTLKPVTNIREYSASELRIHDFITQPATFIRRSVFEHVGLLSEQYRYVFDWEYWIRISQHYDFVRISTQVAGYRITGENLTTTGKTKRFTEMLRLVFRVGGVVDVARFLLRLMKKYVLGKIELPRVQSGAH